MHVSGRQTAIVQAGMIALVLVAFFGTIWLTQDPQDYLPERISRPTRRGVTTGYTFLDWKALMNSGVADSYVDLIARGLDVALVHAQWSVICRNSSAVPEPQRSSVDYFNSTLVDQDYLGNLSAFIRALGLRGVQVVVHVWVSSYTPDWMYPFTPELVGQKDRWPGIDPNTTDPEARQHRDALKYSMVRFQQMLCQYFVDQGLGDDIFGFCLDDETTTSNWTDFFSALTTTIRSFNSSWETMAMFNRHEAYQYTADSGMTMNGMDVYNHDADFVQHLTYAYEHAGTDKLFVIIDAMNEHDAKPENDKLRREAWIAWFMGADAIGWYSFLSGREEWSCAKIQYQDGLPPGETSKTKAALAACEDVHDLNAAWDKVTSVGRDSPEGRRLETSLLRAYAEAKASNFEGARDLLEGVLRA
ncbi:MAG: hypothetical protein ACTSU5_05755 [Promethearchaeota archaeon]